MPTYHVTLDSQGYLIDSATYRKGVASPFAPKQRLGDPGYGDLASASVWAQTDWRGGIGYGTYDPAHPDRYDNGGGIDPSQGDLRLGRDLTQVYSPGSSTSTDWWAFCTYRGVVYAISKSNGKVASSTDGTTWSIARDTGKSSLMSIGLFNGWLVIGSGSDGTIAKFDGTTWTDTWVTLTGTGVHSLQGWAANGSTEYLFCGVSQSSSTAQLQRVDTSGTATVIHTVQLPHIEAMILWDADLIYSAMSETGGYRGEVYRFDGALVSHVATLPDNAVTAFCVFRDPQAPLPATSAPAGQRSAASASSVVGLTAASGASFSVTRGSLLAGARTGGVIWVVNSSGLTELYRFPGVVGIGGTFAYTQPIRGMVMDQGRLHVCILDTNGLGLYVYDGKGWSNPTSGGAGQEPRAVTSFNGAVLFSNKSSSGAKIYKTATTVLGSAVAVTPSYDAGLLVTDKLFLSVTLQHAALASGQTIQVDYDLEAANVWTTLGTSSTVGATSATYGFAAGVKGKRIRFRITLSVSSTSATPALQALLLSYIVAADVKAAWSFDVLLEGTAQEPLILLDQSSEPKTGPQLSAALWTSKAKKSTLTYVDLDGASKTVFLVDVEERVSQRSQRLGWSTRANVQLEEA